MREIKFRAWETKGNLMHYSGNDSTKDNDGGDRYFQTLILPSFAKNKFMEVCLLDNGDFDNDVMDGIIMQYTGLKDKNGVEIYEGDIVAFTDKKILERGSPKKNRLIKWKGTGFNIKPRYAKGGVAIGMEVIGNIYENKELLDESS